MSEKTQTDSAKQDQEQPLVGHLLELRDRLLRIVLAVLVLFVAFFPFANDIYTLLAQPLMQHLPEGSSMVAIEVASPFLIPFKMVLMLSLVIAIPYILYQVWAFIAPGLYSNEKRLAMPLLLSSILLFYIGMAFAYFVVFPLVFGFFTSVAPEGVSVMTDIGHYLDFVNMLFLAFGIAFEVPVATVLLVAIGVTTPEKLASYRPYVFVAAFIIGMFLTPPDVISQILLALPMWILFELGIVFSRMIKPREAEEEAEPEAEADTQAQEAPVAGGGVAAADSSGGDAPEYEIMEEEEYRPLTEEEMEAELDSLEFVDDEEETDPESGQAPVSEDYIPSEDDEAAEHHTVDEALEDEAIDDEDYRPLTEEEMEAELDSLELDEEENEKEDESKEPKTPKD